MCYNNRFFMLRNMMIFGSNMYNGSLAGARCDCTSRESTLASFRTCHLRAHRTSARERTLARRTGHAALFAAHRAARILLDPSLDRLCG
jgi:hypothetical protein